jgi:hypothetical protein
MHRGGRRIWFVYSQLLKDRSNFPIALDYEGIYRKTGGSGQSKQITQLFERGDYDSFDLCDMDRFNDICSVTSVLKTYFRSLPDPLFTYDLHENFMTSIHMRDPTAKNSAMLENINQLPREHYCTLRMLMLHLNRYVYWLICLVWWYSTSAAFVNGANVILWTQETLALFSDVSLSSKHTRRPLISSTATLLRSRDPNAEFGDMAGKALSVEWLVEHAPLVFSQHASWETWSFSCCIF